MTEKILLPIDLAQAEAWSNVVEEAIGMAQRRGAELHVLYVVPTLERNLKRLPEDHQPTLDKFVASRFPNDITVKGHLRSTMDSPHHVIRAVADELGVDLIVMGSQNPRFRDRFMGSNASQVTLYAKCSVYVVR
jgi:nucleotide-binding universal stress UspA family protein